MKRYVHANEQTAEYAIGIIDDKSGKVLGYLSGYARGGFYHPGSIVRGLYDFDEYAKTYSTEQKAKQALAQYKNYSEVFMYDPTSNDYPMPSEKWAKKEVPTHLEVVAEP